MPSTLALLTLSFLSTSSASPLGRLSSLQDLAESTLQDIHKLDIRGLSFSQLFPRQSCANPCGWSGQVCCSSDQYCYTDANNQAQCGQRSSAASNQAGSGSGSGYWQTFTTTFVRTDLVTITSVMSTYVGAASTAAATPTSTSLQCNWKMNESPCGTICCASDQYCLSTANSQCGQAANPGSSNFGNSFTATMSGSTVGFLPPLRPTDSTLITRTTAAASPTTTVAFLAPVATGANVTVGVAAQTGGGGLSGGAIAGIVIGVLLGLALLFLICFYCCLKGLLDGVLALFGFGKKKRREREVEVREEEYVRRSRRGGSRDDRSWYGSERPRRVVREEKRKSGGTGKELLGLGAGLAGLAAVLGLKRKNERRRDEKSYYSGSSETSQTTSESSMSSYVPPPARTRSRSRTVRSVSRSRR
ncbi:hypothetical protein CAC42_6056 [Sphaceloma murrayae]|uniref:Uncharacterized protein n=1 Tax=Sphaceloma murrayae TaxID=2082308 RepID=A0A2K1QV84_9PEZI|nr:hypothetical protein CAC42_6056 [Sphaceloma murrayae]